MIPTLKVLVLKPVTFIEHVQFQEHILFMFGVMSVLFQQGFQTVVSGCIYLMVILCKHSQMFYGKFLGNLFMGIFLKVVFA